MGHDQRGAPLAQIVQRFLHFAFGFRIERRGRLVKKQDGRIFENRPRDRDALALTPGKLGALFADIRFIAGGELQDEIMGMRLARGGDAAAM